MWVLRAAVSLTTVSFIIHKLKNLDVQPHHQYSSAIPSLPPSHPTAAREVVPSLLLSKPTTQNLSLALSQLHTTPTQQDNQRRRRCAQPSWWRCLAGGPNSDSVACADVRHNVPAPAAELGVADRATWRLGLELCTAWGLGLGLALRAAAGLEPTDCAGGGLGLGSAADCTAWGLVLCIAGGLGLTDCAACGLGLGPAFCEDAVLGPVADCAAWGLGLTVDTAGKLGLRLSCAT